MVEGSISLTRSRRDRRRPQLRTLAVLAALVLVGAGVAAAGASAARGRSGLTAVRVRVGDHAGFVRAVIDFSHGNFTGNEVEAVDPQPFDGTASVRLTHPNVRTQALARSAGGVTIRVIRSAGRLRVDISAAPRRFKYLSYAVVTSNRLAVDLWRSEPPSVAGEVRRGAHGCLALDSRRVRAGSVDAAGGEHNLFEHGLQLVLRGRNGDVLGGRSVIAAAGRWHAQVPYRASRRQDGTLEGVAMSPKDGALACLVQVRVTLPATADPAPDHRDSADQASFHALAVRLVHRSHADVDGDGRPDLVTLKEGSLSSPGVLTVRLASGRRLDVKIKTDAVYLPGLVAVGNVDGRPGVELFVDALHVTTAEAIGIYTYERGQLRLAGSFSAYGSDAGILFGITCTTRGSKRFISEHDLWRSYSSPHHWMRRDITYAWIGPILRLVTRGRARAIDGNPSRALVGVHCGQPATAPR